LARDDIRTGSAWPEPAFEQRGLKRSLQTIRERLWFVVAALALGLVAAVVYLATAEPVYEAEADILVLPVPASETILRTVGLIPESSDPAQDVETATHLIDTPEVAAQTAEALGGSMTSDEVAAAIRVDPLPASNIVAVVGSASTAEDARMLANAYASAAVAHRTEELHERIATVLPRLQAQLETLEGDAASELASEVAQLGSLQSGDDPTVRFETPATTLDSRVSPRTLLTIVLGLGAGLAVGLGGAFAAQTLDPRLRREEQLRSRYRLPILTRVPRDAGQHRGVPLAPETVAPATREAYRTLRANVAAAARGSTGARSVLVTGSAPSEGKTTTALNLAASFALAGSSVILIEADLRRPAIADALGVEVGRGLVSTLLEDVSLDDALTAPTPLGPNLRMLLAEYRGRWMSELFSLGAAQQLIEEAKSLAEYVIIDSPPLTAVVDTLPLARQADYVVIVTRLGVTRLDRLHELGELLANNDIKPLGFALLGTPPAPGAGARYYAGPSDRVPEGRLATGRKVLSTQEEPQQGERPS
jgi:polysaccharide biosynthesis transport protein